MVEMDMFCVWLFRKGRFGWWVMEGWGGCLFILNEELCFDFLLKCLECFFFSVVVNLELFLEMGVMGMGGKFIDMGEIDDGGLFLLDLDVGGCFILEGLSLVWVKVLNNGVWMYFGGFGLVKVDEFCDIYLFSEFFIGRGLNSVLFFVEYVLYGKVLIVYGGGFGVILYFSL